MSKCASRCSLFVASSTLARFFQLLVLSGVAGCGGGDRLRSKEQLVSSSIQTRLVMPHLDPPSSLPLRSAHQLQVLSIHAGRRTAVTLLRTPLDPLSALTPPDPLPLFFASRAISRFRQPNPPPSRSGSNRLPVQRACHLYAQTRAASHPARQDGRCGRKRWLLDVRGRRGCLAR